MYAAVRDRRDDRPLLVRRTALRGLAHVVEQREVGTDRYVVPGHEPQAGHVQRHVVVEEPAFVPGRIVGSALDHAATGVHRHGVREDAARTVHGLDDVLHGEMPQRLGPVDRRQLLREIERLRHADQIFLRRVRREHRPDLVLLAVDPGDEQHLDRAAAIPVALLEVRAHAPDAGAKPLDVHRGVGRMLRGRDAHLILRRRRTAGRPDFAVRPGLLREPRERVVAVSTRRSEDVVVALGEEVSALVLHDVGIPALDGGQRGRHVARDPVADVPVVEVVRRAHPDRRHLLRGVLRSIDVGGEPDAVAHRHHDLALDDRNRLQLFLGLPALRLLFRRHRPAPLSERDGRGAGERDEGGYDAAPIGRLHAGAPSLVRGASPLGLPDTLSRAPLRRRAPVAWLARHARSRRGTSGRFMRQLPDAEHSA